MRTATALSAASPAASFAEALEPSVGQIPLPFPHLLPVLPVPVERPDPHSPAPDLRAPATRFVQALAEVLSGERPARQMAAWMAPDVYHQLTARLVVAARAPRRPGTGVAARVVSVHLAMVHEGAVEVAARMVHRGRSRALAVRLELTTTHRGQRVWSCTALEWA